MYVAQLRLPFSVFCLGLFIFGKAENTEPKDPDDNLVSFPILRVTLLNPSTTRRSSMASCLDDIDGTDDTLKDLSVTYEDGETGPVSSLTPNIRGGRWTKLAGFSVRAGMYGIESPTHDVEGSLLHVLNEDGENHACEEIVNELDEHKKWIALVKRGGCKFSQKIHHSSVTSNASAVIIYDNMDTFLTGLIVISHGDVNNVPAIFISNLLGNCLAGLLDGDVPLHVELTRHVSLPFYYEENGATNKGDRGNVMIGISLTFITLLILAIVGIIIYVVRRSKYIQNKNRYPVVFTLQGMYNHQEENLLPTENLANQQVTTSQSAASHAV